MEERDVAPVEEFRLGLDPTDDYRKVSAAIARDRAATENKIAMVLVGALVASLPVYFAALWFCPAQSEQLKDALEKWFTVLGPLAGAAVGVGIGNSKRND